MQELFQLVRLPLDLPINKVNEWKSQVNAKSDCDRLTQILHRDWVARHWKSKIVIAEGFTYMLSWYRTQVLTGLSHLGYDFAFWLLQYSPALDEQATRRAKKYENWSWRFQSPLFHKHEIEEQWNQYQSETPGFSVNAVQVDDQLLTTTIGQIAKQYQ